MLSRLRDKVFAFFESNKDYPILVAFAGTLYPVLYCYTKNYSLVNSVDHFFFFISVFVLLPVIIFTAIHRLFSLSYLKKFQKYILPFFNVFCFLLFINRYHQGFFSKKSVVLIFAFALGFSWFFFNHLKKLIILQFLLAIIASVSLVSVLYEHYNLPNEWKELPDDIVDVVFKKKPNIYYIQPDGYTNFSEIKQGYYNYDNTKFEHFLVENKFKNYLNFRSNYTNTLSSNSASFMMRHHYFYNNDKSTEIYNAREMIITDNPVLKIVKNNGYKTYLITETSYLLGNRPEMGYDKCNIDYDDFSYLNPKINIRHDVITPLNEYIEEDANQPKFFFIEILKPWHIHSNKESSIGKEKEKEKWVENLKASNSLLKEIISKIKLKDPEALIMLMADHGGYVGMDYTHQSNIKTQDRNLIFSMYSSLLSIHWPNHEIPEFDNNLKTPVNTFRILFSYLSEEKKYLSNLEEDASYILLKKDIPKAGIYKYINEKDQIVLESIDE